MATEARPYYEDLGKGCDDLMRCRSCRQLVTARVIAKLGSCLCGSTQVTEIRTLSEQEMADIKSGKIDFPDREQFLAEFAAVDLNAEADDGA